MKTLRYVLAVVILTVSGIYADAQVDKKDVRRGNRDFRKENYREADIDYRKALLKDSTSVAANYNLASVLYRQGDMQQAATTLDRIKESAPATESSADYWYNRGDVALGMKDYQTAVDAFAKSLIIRPEDMDAKENFIYAKKMLENQQNQQNQQNQDQNQDQNQNDDQNKDQNQDQNQNDDQNKDQNQDQNKDQQNQDQNDDRQNKDKQNQQGQEPKLSPQAAQQMLQAIQAKEKETQEKVKEEKAKALKSRQKEKNW
jgi:tetratricopeptide (TPR) repeat protein